MYLVKNRQDAYDRLVRRLTESGRHEEIAALGRRPIGPVDPNKPYHEWQTEDGRCYIVNGNGLMHLPKPLPLSRES